MAHRTPGTSAGLDRRRILTVAVELVDRDGLEKFGIRRLAQALNVDPMSIYHHVKGKAALLDAICETMLAEIRVETPAQTTDPTTDWRPLARATAHAYRTMAYRHPRVFPLLVTRPQTSPAALTALEGLATAMRTAGLPDRVIADALTTLFGFLNGYLLAVLSEDSGRPLPDIDATHYPTMAALAPLTADYGTLAEFDRILDTVLTGIGAGRG
ncbi:TetR/AcrR family transcriptional regulator [Fodinicola acaciae]|uniref:TetR/AcrR family transcriptional regulator n=1 Tax=Fodinicola acaciae TaxID=2681555 RepID=UPI0013D1A091|nr:TetR/AcrR family transcriptional regulator [Fodinicola acaciae]